MSDEQSFEAFDVAPEVKFINMTPWKSDFAARQKPVFTVKGCWLTSAQIDKYGVSVLGSNNQLKKQFTRPNTFDQEATDILFFTHPEQSTQALYLNSGYNPAEMECEEFCATPTSSNRTLLVWSEKQGREFSPVFIKLSMAEESGLKKKAVSSTEAIRSISVNDMLLAQQKIDPAFLNEFPFFKESLAVNFFSNCFLGDEFGNGGGMIVREIPESLLNGKSHIVPALALYGAPTQDDGREPYLLQAYKNKTIDELYETVTEKIIRPFAAQWLKAFLEWGFVTEAHGQNLLVELDEQKYPSGRFWHRDLDGFEIDTVRRSLMGLSTEEKPVPLASGKIHDSIFNKFNLFLYQLDFTILKWKEKRGPEARQSKRLEGILYQALVEQLKMTLQENYAFTFIESESVRFKNKYTYSELKQLFLRYSEVVAEVAKMLTLDSMSARQSFEAGQVMETAEQADADFHLLYIFGFRFEQAIKAVEKKLMNEDLSFYERAHLNQRILKLQHEEMSRGIAELEI